MRRIPVAVATLAMAFSACGGDEVEGFDGGRAFRDLEAQVRFGPRPAGSEANRRMLRFLARRLRAAGAEGVRVQRPYRNLVGYIRGREPGAIVLGAHHDTKRGIAGFVGANDGASGVAVVLELARTLPRPFPGPSIHFALFDAEEARGRRPFTEDGTRGSRQYVRYARRARKARQALRQLRRSNPGPPTYHGGPVLEDIRAMVLFDMVGDCDLQIPREANSDPELYAAFAEAGAPFGGQTSSILDDHIPFLRAGIPALDLIDFTFGPGGSPGAHWHTPADTLDKVCPASLDAVGDAALRALPSVASTL